MTNVAGNQRGLAVIKWLTFFMFMMFAMTTDSVGVIIPEVIKEFHLSMTVAGAFHYATMAGIAFAGIFLGYLADKLGRKKTIILGLILFALNSYLFSVGKSFQFFLVLLVISGTAIGIFKTGALALIGDITRSTTEHTATMNSVEGFFAVGAIIGPAIVARLLAAGTSWKWLYVIAATICVVLIVIASFVRYPQTTRTVEQPIDLKRTLGMMKNPYALGFSAAIFLYVAVECAVYVWMPTLLATYHGSATFMAAYAISIFFILRAVGRFIGSWILGHLNWTAVVTISVWRSSPALWAACWGESEPRFSFCHCRDFSCPSFIPRSTPKASVASERLNMALLRASSYSSLVGRPPWGHWLWAPSVTR